MKNLVADVSGMVQGVGFRYFVEQTAVQLGIDARAENMEDGTVHIVASGDEQRLLRLVELVRQGSRYSSVDHVDYVITDRCA
ncbi:acylphosphatase [Candidatus Cryosericum odellii]|uniref:acylphosphatase n=1 Tax=Candidatus Cryosericum odellii TaxID=2290917 RepID=UPI000F876358|nr:acylphosphatase [Candidatus Cryosericum odellii]